MTSGTIPRPRRHAAVLDYTGAVILRAGQRTQDHCIMSGPYVERVSSNGLAYDEGAVAHREVHAIAGAVRRRGSAPTDVLDVAVMRHTRTGLVDERAGLVDERVGAKQVGQLLHEGSTALRSSHPKG
eukprot:6386485-Prymnesium_polylepis.1